MESARVAVISGAAGTLGYEIARALARSGLRLVLTDRDDEGLDRIEQTLRADSHTVVAVAADITDPTGCATVMRAATDAFRHVDVLVNNAAITALKVWPNIRTDPPKIWEIDDDLYRQFFLVNAVAPHALVRLALPAMLARGWGRIINVTCNFDTMLRFTPYGGTKAALEAYTAALARQLAGTSVSANALVPGGRIVAAGTAAASAVGPQAEASAAGAPMAWLISEAANGVNGQRIVASRWDTTLTPNLAAQYAGAPVGWPT